MKKAIIIICIFIFAGVGMYQLGFKNGEERGIESVEWRWEQYNRVYGNIIDDVIDEWCSSKEEEQGYPSGIECIDWHMEKVYQQAIEEGFINP